MLSWEFGVCTSKVGSNYTAEMTVEDIGYTEEEWDDMSEEDQNTILDGAL